LAAGCDCLTQEVAAVVGAVAVKLLHQYLTR